MGTWELLEKGVGNCNNPYCLRFNKELTSSVPLNQNSARAIAYVNGEAVAEVEGFPPSRGSYVGVIGSSTQDSKYQDVWKFFDFVVTATKGLLGSGSNAVKE